MSGAATSSAGAPCRLLIATAGEMVEHDPGSGHPERPERLVALRRSFEEDPVTSTEWVAPGPASPERCERVHLPEYLEQLEGVRGRSVHLDVDTATSPRSVEAAYLAAGAAVQATEAALAGSHELAVALVRPPGHHAEPDRAMGFCLLNNVAIAAEVAIREHGLERVLIVDWDVHHGNGTQTTFESRGEVLFWSSHRGGGFYPGTGSLYDNGAGDGVGHTVNAPLPAGAGDGLFAALYEQVLAPIARAYRPQLVLVSAGYDSHRRDPLGGLAVTDDGFARLGALVRRLADDTAEGRLALVLEGGYDLAGLVGGLRASVEGALGLRQPAPAPPLNPVEHKLLDVILEAHAAHWPVLAA
ncbi:MAG TPA: histone deacetylase [Thermoanaerobaculia bacterium]|nr:histone deacetylase [Thermoanaerobaculia bacterium]